MNDIFTYFAQLPPRVKGVVEPDENGDYTIYINSLYNREQSLEIFNHEMRHILLRHFDTARPIEEIEGEANERAGLLRKIRRAERCGLPLHSALLRDAPPPPPAPPPPKPKAPPHPSFVRPRPARESPAAQDARLLRFMETVVVPKYGHAFAWLHKMRTAAP